MQLLDGLTSEHNTQPVLLHHDGWLKGPQGRLLLWIPSALQNPLYSMCNILIIPRGCTELDLSTMVHGNQRQECFK
ncbi:hypothetical protein EDC04DRAFT_2647672 [Pisolithus marmoratus]|nr:hypothetical protein EDC04DRAFT_2647672 [Pisolithus marmoratus]